MERRGEHIIQPPFITRRTLTEKTDILSDKMTKGLSENRFRAKNWQKEEVRHGKYTFGTNFEIFMTYGGGHRADILTNNYY